MRFLKKGFLGSGSSVPQNSIDQFKCSNESASSATSEDEKETTDLTDQIPSSYNKTLIDLILIEPNNEEAIPNFEASVTHSQEIFISEVIERLKQLGFPLHSAMISYFDSKKNMFVYIGNDPLPPHAVIPCPPNNVKEIKIKYRYQSSYQHYSNAYSAYEEEEEKSNSIPHNQYMQPMRQFQTTKRTKQRVIFDVLEKVIQWRQYYNGSSTKFNEINKCSLEDAARKVGISKKTLDDYLLQIRLAKKYNFDFEANMHQKIGVLRSFVRKYRSNDQSDRHHERYDDDFMKGIIEIYEKYGKNNNQHSPHFPQENFNNFINFNTANSNYHSRQPAFLPQFNAGIFEQKKIGNPMELEEMTLYSKELAERKTNIKNPLNTSLEMRDILLQPEDTYFNEDIKFEQPGF